jgi:hypothetical protein
LAGQLSLNDLTPFARRSYPAYLLADEQSWLAIEKGKEANLALSAEEEQILKSVSTSIPGHGSLPLFINDVLEVVNRQCCFIVRRLLLSKVLR